MVAREWEAQSCHLRNHFLLAMPGLQGGLFSHSITYLCEHGESGAMGIIVNQPLQLTLDEIFDHLDIEPCADFSHVPVLAGGPVQMDHGFVLHRCCGDRWGASLRVTDSICLSTSRDILKAIAAGAGPEDFIVALGYAGWAAGQLEEEITNNSWLTLPADPAILFETPHDKRLHRAAGSMGVDINLISTEAGHA